MNSFLKLQFILVLLYASSLSTIAVSLDAKTKLLDGSSSPNDVTCAVSQDKCSSECDRRCSATSHKNNCLLFCNKCCNKCLCVPPGTFGNKECCPCYNDWKTQEGGPKCP